MTVLSVRSGRGAGALARGRLGGDGRRQLFRQSSKHRLKLRRPGGGISGEEVRLRFQDDAIIEDLQAVGAQGLASRRNVDDSAVPAAGAPSVAPALSMMR